MHTTTVDRAVLVHGAGFDPSGIADALESEGVRVRQATVPDVDGAEVPTVLVLDGAQVRAMDDVVTWLSALPAGVVVVSWGEAAERAVSPHDRFFMALPDTAGPRVTLKALQAAFRHAALQLGTARMELELEKSRGDLDQLNQIGMALMTERDPDRLLDKILDRAMSMTQSDGGSLYLVEDDPEHEDKHRLRFKLSKTLSLPDLPAIEFTLPMDQTSIAGWVAVNNKPLRIDDAYAISDSAPYSFNRGFDEEYGYRAKSMLVVPMADHKDEVVGVVQLINRKRDPEAVITDDASAAEHVLSYGRHDRALVRGLAGQAAVSIENARLYEQIEDIFEAFVRAAVAAIDQRDPTTAGHSVRVAALTTRIARVLPRLTTGRWAGTQLSRDQMKELRYAALLHDFGKVGVREQVLVKARKLPPTLWERLDARFDLIHRTIEKNHLERKLTAFQQADLQGLEGDPDRIDAELRDRLQRLEEFREAIRNANEPSILPEEGEALLNVIAGETYQNIDGEEVPYLRDEELAYLSIPKGSLNEDERKEIESHVTQTYNFLTQIPWTEDLDNVASIAYGHHEKLDGRGYPRGIAGDDIPVQTRIMTIADIFDALTASDRPYKKAMDASRALEILRMEADDGMLDGDLVTLTVESGVYEEVLKTDWREL